MTVNIDADLSNSDWTKQTFDVVDPTADVNEQAQQIIDLYDGDVQQILGFLTLPAAQAIDPELKAILEMRLTTLVASDVAKHLSGKHDQKTHGRGRGRRGSTGGGDKAFEMSSSDPRAAAKFASTRQRLPDEWTGSDLLAAADEAFADRDTQYPKSGVWGTSPGAYGKQVEARFNRVEASGFVDRAHAMTKRRQSPIQGEDLESTLQSAEVYLRRLATEGRENFHEEIFIINRDGAVEYFATGDKHAVGVTITPQPGSTFTHNHPSSSALSTTDINLAVHMKADAIRAVTQYGVYEAKLTYQQGRFGSEQARQQQQGQEVARALRFAHGDVQRKVQGVINDYLTTYQERSHFITEIAEGGTMHATMARVVSDPATVDMLDKVGVSIDYSFTPHVGMSQPVADLVVNDIANNKVADYWPREDALNKTLKTGPTSRTLDLYKEAVLPSAVLDRRVATRPTSPLPDVIASILKHGTHDQKTHGRRRGATIVATKITNRMRANAEKALDRAALTAQTEALFLAASPAAVEYGATWYDRANGVANDLADEFGVSIEAAAGVLAATSPRNRWSWPGEYAEGDGTNIELARRILATVTDDPTVTITAELAQAVYDKDRASGSSSRRNNPLDARDHVGTHRMSELPANVAAAFTADVGGGLRDNTAKAIALARGGDPDEILGGDKVRSFYNNIVDPQHPSVTIDTHQVRAMVGDVSLPDKDYADALSTSAKYNLHAEVVAEVAAKHGVRPHVVQATMWEEWRIRYPASARREATSGGGDD